MLEMHNAQIDANKTSPREGSKMLSRQTGTEHLGVLGAERRNDTPYLGDDCKCTSKYLPAYLPRYLGSQVVVSR
jgi:hypothetical protein